MVHPRMDQYVRLADPGSINSQLCVLLRVQHTINFGEEAQ
jgi:hypothetical protein